MNELRWHFGLLSLACAGFLACVDEDPTDGSGTGGTSGASSGGSPATGGAQPAGAGGTLSPNGGSAGSSAGSSGASASGGSSAASGAGGSAGVGTTGGTGGATGGSGGEAASGGTAGVSGFAGSNAGGAGAGGSAGSMGGKAGGAGKGGAGGAGGAAGGPTLPPITDYKSMGPYTTTVERNTGPNGQYTVFRPQTLGQNGFLHAPIIFGPGIGQQVSVHTTMLTNFASHGFVVVGTPVLSGGPGDAGNRMTMLNGLNWIVAQNSAANSIYQGKLYADHAVSMGFSVGGTSAVEIGGEAAVATVVSIHGHRAMAALHGPMLQTTGTGDTVGLPLQQATYDMSRVPTFLATLTGAGHTYIEMNGGGEERPAILAWMRYWIYNDAGARNHFFGDTCVLCMSPWQNPQRKNWQ
ncbi:MAG TPA: hypothetical protein VFZ53_35025 [Polyangiaceae bacterium]